MKNKICTSLEQSQKLLELGVNTNVQSRSRRIVNEYWADGEWHYEYKVE